LLKRCGDCAGDAARLYEIRTRVGGREGWTEGRADGGKNREVG